MNVIKSNRLKITPAELSEASFYFELLNSANWIKHIGDRGIKTIVEAENYILSLQASYVNLGFGLYTVSLLNDNTPIGIAGLLQREYLPHPDLGFAILPAFERKGYTLEACEAILLNSPLSNIMAITSNENPASQALLKKLGFEYVNMISITNEELLLFEITRP